MFIWTEFDGVLFYVFELERVRFIFAHQIFRSTIEGPKRLGLVIHQTLMYTWFPILFLILIVYSTRVRYFVSIVIISLLSFIWAVKWALSCMVHIGIRGVLLRNAWKLFGFIIYHR